MKPTAPLLAVAVVAAAVYAALARREPPVAPTSYEPVRAPGAAWAPAESPRDAPPASLRGKVLEVIDVAEYTYLRLATSAGEQWSAVSKTSVLVGSTVDVLDAALMENFASPTLGRTFPVIYFGRLGDAATQALPPGHPTIGERTLAPSPHAAAPSVSSALVEVPVPPARGEDAHVIADLYASRDRLRGRVVRVSGQVVKVTSGVLGKNYVRIRDGSSPAPEQGERELVVTTLTSCAVGSLVTLKGTLQTDVDVGIGYSYPLLLADAEVEPTP